MKGFADKALIVFPKFETYEFKNDEYKYHVRKAVMNLLTYFKEVGIQSHFFYTDDIARALLIPGITYVSTLNISDRYFVSQNCDGMSNAMDKSIIQYPEVYAKYSIDDPDLNTLSVQQRFNLVMVHNNKAAMDIAQDYKILVHFVKPRETQYNFKSKNQDGRIYIEVNMDRLTPAAYISGTQVSPIDIFNRPYANRAMHVWEVSQNGLSENNSLHS